MQRFVSVLIVLMICFSGVIAQENTTDNVHLFQSFFRDAPITKLPYVDAGVDFNSYEYLSTFNLGARGGIPIKPNFDIGAALAFLTTNPEYGDGHNGLSDIWVSAKYRFDNIFQAATQFSAGGYITLPTGSEDVGQSHFNFGAFGALRHALDQRMTVHGMLGLDFMETYQDDRETSLRLGGGVIYTYDAKLNFVGELLMQTEGDYAMLSAGADYLIAPAGRVRGALGLGLDDGAPDFSFMASYLLFF